MGLESGTYIANLDANNPLATDGKSQGDDHLRLIKSTLKATFPNASKPFRLPESVALQSGNYAPNATTGDGLLVPVSAEAAARTVTLPAAPAYDGYCVRIVKADHSANLITVSGNGKPVNGGTSFTLYQRYQSALCVYCASIDAWLAQIDAAVPIATMAAVGTLTAPDGWVRLNGRTIGNALSGAAERANADTLGLYTVLWNSFSNTVCPVSGGRGANAAADYAASKALALPDLRGRALFGLDDMGSTAAGRITNAVLSSGTVNGTSGGSQTVALIEAELPSHLHGVGTLATGSAGGHQHFITSSAFLNNSVVDASTTARSARSVGDVFDFLLPQAAGAANAGLTSSNGIHTHAMFGSTGAVGSGSGHSNMPPAFLSTFIMKL